MGITIGCVLSMMGLMSGCLPATKTGFDSPAPSKRIDAIIDASALEDDESLVQLVEMLRSNAPSERMFAIRSLEIRTGETLGYQHSAHDWQRVEAVGRWVEYLDEQGISTANMTEPGNESTNESVLPKQADGGENDTI